MFRPEIRLERSAEIFGGNALLRAKFVLDELLLGEAGPPYSDLSVIASEVL
jgi:hypothetical protein